MTSFSKKDPEVDELLARAWAKHPNLMPELDFLNSVFSFMNRRSTYLAESGSSKKVLQLVNKYIDEAKEQKIQEAEARKKKDQESELENPKKTKEQEHQAPKTTTVTPTATKTKNSDTTKQGHASSTTAATQTTTTQPNSATEKTVGSSESTSTSSSSSTENKDENKDENKEEKKEQTKEEKDKNLKPPINNGAVLDNYIWTQTLGDLEVRTFIPPNAKSKDLDIITEKRRLIIGVKGKPPLINGELHDDIVPRETSWTIDHESGRADKTLTLALKKKNNVRLWCRLLVGEPEIDTSKIAPETANLHELDPETQQQVEKLMVEQRQKMMGIPTQQELEHQKIIDGLRKQFPETDFSQTKFTT